MTLKYNINGKEFKVYLSPFGEDIVEVQDNKTYKRTIREDDGGKFFTWNKSKVYLDDFKKVPMSELKKRIDANEWITNDDLTQSILTDGVDNVRFEIPFEKLNCRCFGLASVDSSKRINVPCKIKESYNRTIRDNYKYDFYPLSNKDAVMSHHECYVLDFVSDLRNGYSKILPSVNI